MPFETSTFEKLFMQLRILCFCESKEYCLSVVLGYKLSTALNTNEMQGRKRELSVENLSSITLQRTLCHH